MHPNRAEEHGGEGLTHLVAAIIEGLRAAGPASGGHTTADVARRYRVGEDRVRAWIKRGLLKAINTADVACAKPRFIILPESLVAFEQARSAAPLPKPTRRRQQGRDYYPD